MAADARGETYGQYPVSPIGGNLTAPSPTTRACSVVKHAGVMDPGGVDSTQRQLRWVLLSKVEPDPNTRKQSRNVSMAPEATCACNGHVRDDRRYR